MKTIQLKSIIAIISYCVFYITSVYGAFGIQIGSYANRPAIPPQIQQSNLSYEIIEQDGFFKLIIGPYEKSADAVNVRIQNSLNGFLTQYTSQKTANSANANQTQTNALANQSIVNNNIANRSNNLAQTGQIINGQFVGQNTNTNRSISTSNNTQANQPIANNRQPLVATNTIAYAVELLSARDKNSIPLRIIDQIFASGFTPKFVLDQGLYRLVVGPFNSEMQAIQINGQISNAFGRTMFTISLPRSRFLSAQILQRPTAEQIRAEQIRQDRLNIGSNDRNEHLGYLESQRRMATTKYNTQPYGPTTNNATQTTTLTDPLSNPSSSAMAQNRQLVPFSQGFNTNPSTLPILSNAISKSGYIISVAAMSSKNELSVNGKSLGGSFSVGVELGYKFNDNTLLKVGYFAPEIKTTSVFLDNNQSVDISSKYDLMGSMELQYRYFLPTYAQIFFTSNFGMNFVKQNVLSLVPLNFGTSYNYDGYYVQPSLGLGAGFRINKSLSLGLNYNAYFTLKTVTSNVKFYFNYEL